MAVRSSSWSKHVHRPTVQQPTDNDCNACQYNTDVGGQDCKVTTHHRDTDSSTFGSHIHRGIGACCQGTARDRHGCENMCVHHTLALIVPLPSIFTNMDTGLQAQTCPCSSRGNAPAPLSSTNHQHKPLQPQGSFPLL